MSNKIIAWAASALAVTAVLAGPTQAAHADPQCPTWDCTPTVERTSGMGVGWRNSPGASVTGFGAREGVEVPVSCWVRGPGVGSNGNTIWWKVLEARGQWYVSDHWLSTPAPYTSGGVMWSPIGGHCIG